MISDKIAKEEKKSGEEDSDEEEMLLLDGEMEVEEKGTQDIPLKASMDMFWQEPSTGPNKVPSDDEAGSDTSETSPKKAPSEVITDHGHQRQRRWDSKVRTGSEDVKKSDIKWVSGKRENRRGK